MASGRPKSAPYLPTYRSRDIVRPSTAGPGHNREARVAQRRSATRASNTSSTELQLRSELRQMVRDAAYAGGVYVRDPLKASTRHYCGTPHERGKRLAQDSSIVCVVREPLRRSQVPATELRARPSSVSAVEIERRRQRCRRTVDDYRRSGGRDRPQRPQSASCVESWEDRLHNYVKQEAAWIRNRTSASKRAKSAKGARGERSQRVGSTVVFADEKELLQEQDDVRHPATETPERWVHDYFRMCSNSMDLRQHFLAAEELLSQEDTPIGPSLESCKQAIVHLDIFLQENSMNLRARMMQRRAVRLRARHRLGEKNTNIVVSVAEQQKVKNEADITQLMASLADEGFDHTNQLDAQHAHDLLAKQLCAYNDENDPGQGEMPASARRAPGAEHRKPIPTGSTPQWHSPAARRPNRVARGFDSMALGKVLMFPDGTSRAVFSEAAYEEALNEIEKAARRK